jgi:hypothetical protein
MWHGIFGNVGGSSIVLSKMRKKAALVAHFMLQMMQTPLFSKDNEKLSNFLFSVYLLWHGLYLWLQKKI